MIGLNHTQLNKFKIMQKYIGCKIIQAEPINENKFLRNIKNQDVPKNKEDQSGYLVQYPDGYVSWSPREVFETAYRVITRSEMELIENVVVDFPTPKEQNE